jgi:hypothetical protein
MSYVLRMAVLEKKPAKQCEDDIYQFALFHREKFL